MKKLILIFLFLGLLLPASLVLAQQSAPDSDVNVIIKQLQDQIKNLQTQITELQSQLESVKVELKFSRTLVRGVKGDEVKQLQEFLKTMPDIYPEGLTTGYFGPLTEAAVKRFQEKQGIESVGFVGPKTIAKLNEVVGTTSAIPATPATPATPAIPAIPGLTPAIPAVPATPAVPAVPAQLQPFQPPINTPVVLPPSVISTTTVSATDLSIINVAPGALAPASPNTLTPTPTPIPTSVPTPTPTTALSSCTDADKTLSIVSHLTGADFGETSADISWTTDGRATSQINYGLTSSYGSSTPIDNTLATSHAVHISGLTMGTTYHYQISGKDCAGNLILSKDYVINTQTPTPVISSLQSTEVTKTTAKITWITDIASNSSVMYDMFNTLATHNDSSSSSCSGYQVPSTSHCVLLNNLYPSTLYYYQAISAAEFSPGIFSDINQFTTQGTSAPNPPILDPISSTLVPVHLTWSPAQTDGYYKIVRKPGPSAYLQYPNMIKYYDNWYVVGQFPASYYSSSADDQYAEVGTTYQYYMRYCNISLGCSGPSNIQSVTVGSSGAIDLKHALASILRSITLILQQLQQLAK